MGETLLGFNALLLAYKVFYFFSFYFCFPVMIMFNRTKSKKIPMRKKLQKLVLEMKKDLVARVN